jgi:phage terminase large subunit
MHVWEGHCRQNLTGAVYGRELREAELAGRMTKVPYDRTVPVHTFWDLGWADKVSIWFAQAVGMEYRIIDFLQDNQRTIESFIRILQSKGYMYGTDYLPHDAGSTSLAAGGRTVEKLFRDSGRSVQVLPRISILDGINAARTIFPNCWFDAEKCAEGIVCLRRYRYDVDPDTNMFSNKPLHDEFSHGADAFRYLAVSLRDKKRVTLNLDNPSSSSRLKLSLDDLQDGTSWMSR